MPGKPRMSDEDMYKYRMKQYRNKVARHGKTPSTEAFAKKHKLNTKQGTGVPLPKDKPVNRASHTAALGGARGGAGAGIGKGTGKSPAGPIALPRGRGQGKMGGPASGGGNPFGELSSTIGASSRTKGY